MKKIAIFLLILTGLLVFDVTKTSNHTVIIYTPMEQFRSEELSKQLKEEFPELSVEIMYMSTGKTAAKISIEKESTDADIVVGLDTAYMDKINDFLEFPYPYSHLEYLPEFVSTKKNYLIWDREAGSIIVNTDVLEKNGLPIPHTYDDLLDPVYKNMIAMPDPKSSGTGYFFYKGLVNHWGETKTLEYFDELAPNIKQFTESGSGPIKLLIQKETAVGLGLTFQAVDELNKGNPFKLITPEYGAPYFLTGVGMIKGRSHNKNVERVFEYIVNDFLRYDKEHFCPDVILKDQINNIYNYPQEVPYADMTGIDNTEEKERLLALWKY
ncbi:MAG: extracellular solute-binding protein [Clostridiales bacterium]|nr:extracellular solute-binding protein [Clostridiales bacterium]